MAAEALFLLIQKGVDVCYGKRNEEMYINSSFKKMEGTGDR